MPKDMTKDTPWEAKPKRGTNEYDRQEAKLIAGFIAICVIFLAVCICGAVMIARAIIGG
jgi:hypothetical protein